MEDAEPTVRRRVLPSWMTHDKKDPKKPNTGETRRRRKWTEISSRKRTVYCMNEKELMECALEILSQSKVQRDSEEETKPQLQEDKEDPSPEPPISPQSKKPPATPPTSDDPDNDPLKFVREIFFS
ncbi:cell cycle regulator of non-homologous end joining [Engystomops pustulosus]|uniref:cell cycle regulator of non-homologous end joining n=1 Tax=Engystomops pustulosus TaxID=76066 RepID=UPI003AFB1A47